PPRPPHGGRGDDRRCGGWGALHACARTRADDLLPRPTRGIPAPRRLPARPVPRPLAPPQEPPERPPPPGPPPGAPLPPPRVQQLTEPLVPPEGDRGGPGGDHEVRDRRHRLPAVERHPRPPPHPRSGARRLLRAGVGAGALDRLRRQRERDRRAPPPPGLRAA